MCIKTYHYFTKCDHVSATLTTCPTHHKQQESTKGLFGALFRRSLRKKKNCGKVIPHHLQNDTYCQDCSVRRGHFTAQSIGNGALRVRKQDIQERLYAGDKEAARLALQKTKRHNRRHPHHQVLHSETETSVWLTDLYHHPETLAKKEAYARSAAKAPPVSSSSHRRAEYYPRPLDLKPRKAQVEYAGGGSREFMPTYGYSKPMMRPVQPAPTHRYAGHDNYSPNLPRDYRSFAARTEAAGRGKVLPERKQYPELRHKTGYRDTAGGSNKQPASPREAFMNGEPKAKTNAAPRAKQQPSTPRQTNHMNTARPLLTTLSSWVENNKLRRIPSDDDESSFVCQTSKAISNQQQARSARHKRRQ